MPSDVTMWTQNDVKSQKWNISRLFLYRTETLYTCYTYQKVQGYFHCDISMATQLALSPLHSKGKSEFSSFKKCYLLLLFIQWV